MSDQQRANDIIAKANALQADGQKLEAAPLYLEAAQLFAPYGSFALVAGDSFREAGKDDEAAQAYRICLNDVPEHEQALEGLAEVLVRGGQVDEAQAAYKRAGVAFPKRLLPKGSPGAKKGFFARLFGK